MASLTAPTTITKTTADVFIPELWSLEVQEAAQFERNAVNRVYTPPAETFKYGDTVHIPVSSNMTASTKSSGTEVTFEAITETKTDLAINQHKYVAFIVEDIVDAQSNVDQMKQYRAKIAYPLERAKEILITALFDGFTGNATVGTAGQAPVWSDFTTIWQRLQEAGVGQGNLSNDTSLFLSPAMVAACQQLDVFISEDYGGKGVVASGNINKSVLGMPVFVSNLLESDASGQHDSAAFHRSALAFVDQVKIKIDSQYLIQMGGDAVLAQAVYGAIELGQAPETAGGGSAVDTRGVYFAGV